MIKEQPPSYSGKSIRRKEKAFKKFSNIFVQEKQMIQIEALTNKSIDKLKTGTHFIDFHADWCQPCKLLGRIIECLEQSEITNKITFHKFDIEQEGGHAIAENYHISGLPTVLLIQDGQVIDSLVGLQTKQKLLSFINQE